MKILFLIYPRSRYYCRCTLGVPRASPYRYFQFLPFLQAEAQSDLARVVVVDVVVSAAPCDRQWTGGADRTSVRARHVKLWMTSDLSKST